MANNTATQAIVNLQITDLLTVGSPIIYQRTSGPIIFNAATNNIIEYLLLPIGSSSLPIPTTVSNSTIGTLYVKNISIAGSPIPLLQLQQNSGTFSMPFGPGAVFLFSIAGNTGAVGIPVGTGANQITNITLVCTVPTPLEFLCSN